MTPQQIKDAAPEGATHYIKFNNSIFYVKGQLMWIKGVWEFGVFDIMDLKPL